jgi:copper chaperone
MAGAAASAEHSAASTEVYRVEGMTCEHCVAAVRGELLALDAVTAVDVLLVAGGPSRVAVQSLRPLAVGAVEDAVAEAGYRLVVDR